MGVRCTELKLAFGPLQICHIHYDTGGVCRFVEQNSCNLSIANEECSTMTSYEWQNM